uniref:uncharacterized protein C3orf38 homolog n=1 Tax=Monopterus albus TaxID=43700 RepID=UPI0009B4DBA8|nr:uncharacterized protein C3orf38 homolog [Monopterus albus]
MSRLTKTERLGCREILKLMSKDDILSLFHTVTNKMIAAENIKEARKAILSFTKNAEEFLKRKKVHRDLIFKYLAMQGVAMPSNSEKLELVKKTLELWSCGKKAVVDESLPEETNASRPRGPTETPSGSTDMKTEVGFDPLLLGHQFCQWFFQLLNSQNPTLGQQPQDWGPQHFWPNAKLSLLYRSGSEQLDELLGAELLVLVGVAGTIHRGTIWLGIFEQIFGLIRSPLEANSWKIKFINLKIRGQDAVGGTEVAAPALTYTAKELQFLCS